MEKYGEFPVIDKLASDYGYKHAEVFEMSWRDVYTIVALNREQNYIEYKATELKRESEKKT